MWKCVFVGGDDGDEVTVCVPWHPSERQRSSRTQLLAGSFIWAAWLVTAIIIVHKSPQRKDVSENWNGREKVAFIESEEKKKRRRQRYVLFMFRRVYFMGEFVFFFLVHLFCPSLLLAFLVCFQMKWELVLVVGLLSVFGCLPCELCDQDTWYQLESQSGSSQSELNKQLANQDN